MAEPSEDRLHATSTGSSGVYASDTVKLEDEDSVTLNKDVDNSNDSFEWYTDAVTVVLTE